MPTPKPASNPEMLEMMKRCRAEIEMLQKVNEMLQPKAEAYDMLCKIIRIFSPQGFSSNSSDTLLRALTTRIDELGIVPVPDTKE